MTTTSIPTESANPTHGWLRTALGIVLGALLVSAAGLGAGMWINGDKVSASADQRPAPAVATDVPSQAVYTPPTPADFAIGVRILRKACFGSAGCNVNYQIDPKYSGAASLPGHTVTVIYEISGGKDGTQVNNFTIKDGTASYPRQEFASTASSTATLTARVTSVSAD